MKTRTTFELSTNEVTIKLYDVTGQDKGYKLADLEPMATKVLGLDDLPTTFDADSDKPKSLLAYGLSQFVQDRTASLTDKVCIESGMNAQAAIEAKLDAIQEVFDMLLSGRMTKERAKGEGKKATIDVFFVKAFVEMVADKKGQELTDEQAMIILQNKMDNEQRKAIRASLQSRINELRAEANKQAEEFDLDSLF